MSTLSYQIKYYSKRSTELYMKVKTENGEMNREIKLSELENTSLYFTFIDGLLIFKLAPYFLLVEYWFHAWISITTAYSDNPPLLVHADLQHGNSDTSTNEQSHGTSSSHRASSGGNVAG